MKRKKHTESQIISILKEQESGMKIADICRHHGISQTTFLPGRVNIAARMLGS